MARTSARHTNCPRCGAQLARDNTSGRCGPCQAAEHDRLISPPALPADFWNHEPIRQALAERHLGKVIRAYRHHPYHGRDPLPQETVGRWLGITQAQMSRLENGRPVVHLDRLTHWAQVLRVPAHLLWFKLRDDKPDAASRHDGRPASAAIRAEVAREPKADVMQVQSSPYDFLLTLRRIRAELDASLAMGTMSLAELEQIEESVDEHVRVYPCTAPAAMLTRLAADCVEVQMLSRHRQPAAIQARLSGAAALLATMCAEALMRLGCTADARRWYRTAMTAADDSADPRLRVLVRAQAAMLPYYFADPAQTVTLADLALNLSSTPCASMALAAAARARALARLGAHHPAREAIGQARRMFDTVDEPDTNAAFRFPAKRFLLYLSGTATWLGDTATAYQAQDEALSLYRSAPGSLIDPALLHLDRAMCLVQERRVPEAASVARQAIDSLPPTQRTELVLTRAEQVIDAAPAAEQGGELAALAEQVGACRSQARTLAVAAALV
ncbi:MAG TPA: helix-turn-helix transcriptional regulator [Micromonospora sp.]|nr:helix-turn-helix transcriptional regulator [Micromonospora sp.]